MTVFVSATVQNHLTQSTPGRYLGTTLKLLQSKHNEHSSKEPRALLAADWQGPLSP